MIWAKAKAVGRARIQANHLAADATITRQSDKLKLLGGRNFFGNIRSLIFIFLFPNRSLIFRKIKKGK
jgi:hypothetical protein